MAATVLEHLSTVRVDTGYAIFQAEFPACRPTSIWSLKDPGAFLPAAQRRLAE